jgi:hypothetical protein
MTLGIVLSGVAVIARGQKKVKMRPRKKSFAAGARA